MERRRPINTIKKTPVVKNATHILKVTRDLLSKIITRVRATIRVAASNTARKYRTSTST